MKRYELVREQLIERPRDEVFRFFSRADNLERITPRQLRFEILTPRPIRMAAGTRIDYRIRLFGLPMRWQTLIESFDPDEGFVDVQVRGPYALWRHTHSFSDHPRGTLMCDRVEYALPFGAFGRLACRLFVRRQLDSIFDHRRAIVGEAFRSPLLA